jgi:hypothetical protein
MKFVPIAVILSLLIMCGSRSAKPQERSDFSDFISRFDSLSLPISFLRSNAQREFDTVNRKDPTRPFYQQIEPKHYKYLQNEAMNDKLCQFRFLFASKREGFYVVLYEQLGCATDSHWVKMNTLDSKGKIINTLVLASGIANVSEEYGWIEDWKIKTSFFEFLPDEPGTDALVANNEIEEFILTSDGHFKKISSSKKKGYFTFGEDTNLVPDKKKK